VNKSCFSLHLSFSMDRMSSDVLSLSVIPFLQMRDFKSLRACSKKLWTQLPPGGDYRSLNQFICGFSGCRNRAFLSRTVDPFLYHATRDHESLCMDALVSMCMFPLYASPFYRILYHLVVRETVGINSTDHDAGLLMEAFVSYHRVSTYVRTLTDLPSMDWHCSCLDALETLSGVSRTVCEHHRKWTCPYIDTGSCIGCLVTTAAKHIDKDPSSIPYSFFFYVLAFVIFPVFILVPCMIVTLSISTCCLWPIVIMWCCSTDALW
jgi:hypothetical protein